MLMKRIEAPTLAEALQKTRAECGEDALVIETHETRRGYVIIAARPTEPVRKSANIRSRGKPTPAGTRWTQGFRQAADDAARFGLSEALLRAIENAMIGTRVSLSRAGDPAVVGIAERILAALIKIEPAAAKPTATALVGPTGVGKTTTLAKLAAQAVRDRHETTAIITLDTYRVAAVEQLRAFADMLAVPFEVAFTPQDLRRAILDHAGKHRIFIDTSGRSPFDRQALETLRATLQVTPVQRALCLPAHARRTDAMAILDAFGILNPDCAVITKWDETTVPGEALSTVIEQGLPISHITIGQEVPDDILPADARTLAHRAFALEQETLEVTR